MKIKTENLAGKFLDWAVSKASGEVDPDGKFFWRKYSTDWAHGGPVIEREAITIEFGRPELPAQWSAFALGMLHKQPLLGTTPLIAAMRCYVAKKLGEEVEVPE